jgi:hypothetical protein
MFTTYIHQIFTQNLFRRKIDFRIKCDKIHLLNTVIIELIYQVCSLTPNHNLKYNLTIFYFVELSYKSICHTFLILTTRV